MLAEYINLADGIRSCAACYFRDAQITPLAAVHTTPPVAIMFIGENPSWADGQDVPFDIGTISGQSLDINFLRPLGLSRDDVWITDLFKCRYPKSVYRDKKSHEGRIRDEVVESCKRWLVQEIAYARPKIVVTLSDSQVYRRLRNAFSLTTPVQFSNASGRAFRVELGGIPVVLFPMVHPDIARPLDQGDARKPRPREKWTPIHKRDHLPALATLLSQS